jgi:5-amino-6-(5-phospho-D-ribitylamino)uracil phosphatase
MVRHFYLTDLDGTLLRSDAAASEYTIEVLSEALDRGAVISYATARGYVSSSRAAAGVPWKYPLVLFNGALIYDPMEKRVLDGFWLDAGAANDIIGLGKEFGLTPLLFALDHDNRERVLHERLHRTGDKEFHRSRPGDPRFREVERLFCPEDYRTLTLTYIGLKEELEPLRDKAAALHGDRAHINLMKDNYIEDHYFLELSHVRANKREGTLLWCKLVGCEPAEVTVFGDNLNDTGLFEAAGCRVAVENAHPALIRMADAVIPSNNEDGVALYIKDRMTAGTS